MISELTGNYSMRKTIKVFLGRSRLASQFVVGTRRARRLKNVSDYFRRVPTMGYIGWVNQHNLGDEALYDAYVDLFPQFAMLGLIGLLPAEYWLHSRVVRGGSQFDALMVGGGTLINHGGYLSRIERAQTADIPSFVFGTGVLDLDLWASDSSDTPWEEHRDRWAACLSKSRVVAVRGPRSAANLQSIGIDGVQVVGDPALSVCAVPDSARSISTRRMAINIGNIGPSWGSVASADALALEVTRNLVADGWTVDAFGMHRSDLDRIHKLKHEMSAPIDNIWFEPDSTQAFLARLEGYDFVLSQKLHGTVLASGLGIPNISLAYDPKCLDFMDSMNAAPLVLRLDQTDATEVLDAIDRVVGDYSSVSASLIERTRHWQRVQKQSASEIAAMVLGSA